MIALTRALSQHRRGHEHPLLCLPAHCGLGSCCGCRDQALCSQVPHASGAVGKLPGTSSAYGEGIIPSSLSGTVLSTLSALPAPLRLAIQMRLPLGRGDVLAAGKVNAESALQRRSAAFLTISRALFLCVTLSYLSCFRYGINGSCSPALCCSLNILF